MKDFIKTSICFILYFTFGLSITSYNELNAQSFSPGVQSKQTVVNGYDYIAYLPEGYDNIKEFPLFFYLHGGNGVKVKTFVDLREFHFGPPALINNKENPNNKNVFTHSKLDWPTEDFIVIMPHLPCIEFNDEGNCINENDRLWNVDSVNKVMKSVLTTYENTIDLERIYLSGISLGAKGVWDYAMAYPDSVAAIVPISGNAFPDELCKLADIPIWAFHGDKDPQVWPDSVNTQGRSGTYILIDSINTRCNSTFPPLLTKMLFKVHEPSVWDNIYDLTSGFDIYSWLKKYKNNDNQNIAPTVKIIGTSRTILKDDFPLILYGKTFDIFNHPINYEWTFPSSPETDVSITADTMIVVKNLPLGPNTITFNVNNGTTTVSDHIVITVEEQVDNQMFIEELQVFNENNEEINLQQATKIEINTVQDGVKFRIVAKVPVSTNGVRWAFQEDQNFRSVNKYGGDRSEEGIYYLFNNNNFWSPEDGIYQITITPFGGQNPLRNPGFSKTITVGINEVIPLPVEFLDVSAKRDESKAIISWSTATEKNNDFFTIERSSETGDSFEAIGTQKGAGDSHQIKHYSFTDNYPLASGAYYRIKQTDYNGQSDYSKIVRVNGLITSVTHTAPFDAAIFPNPIEKENLHLRIKTLDLYSQVFVTVIDALGNPRNTQIVNPNQIIRPDGYLLSDVNTLSAGLYFIVITQGGHRITKKLLVR